MLLVKMDGAEGLRLPGSFDSGTGNAWAITRVGGGGTRGSAASGFSDEKGTADDARAGGGGTRKAPLLADGENGRDGGSGGITEPGLPLGVCTADDERRDPDSRVGGSGGITG